MLYHQSEKACGNRIPSIDFSSVIKCDTPGCQIRWLVGSFDAELFFIKMSQNADDCPLDCISLKETFSRCQPLVKNLYDHSDPSVIDAIERALGI
ncbi:hypothetical protein HDE_11231 [Halotydeus destructor]|nr:hypothetical protein HDE_11231 [Halotydeus destructor]